MTKKIDLLREIVKKQKEEISDDNDEEEEQEDIKQKNIIFRNTFAENSTMMINSYYTNST